MGLLVQNGGRAQTAIISTTFLFSKSIYFGMEAALEELTLEDVESELCGLIGEMVLSAKQKDLKKFKEKNRKFEEMRSIYCKIQGIEPGIQTGLSDIWDVARNKVSTYFIGLLGGYKPQQRLLDEASELAYGKSKAA